MKFILLSRPRCALAAVVAVALAIYYCFTIFPRDVSHLFERVDVGMARSEVLTMLGRAAFCDGNNEDGITREQWSCGGQRLIVAYDNDDRVKAKVIEIDFSPTLYDYARHWLSRQSNNK